MSRAQLLAAGVTGRQINHRVRTGTLLPLFRGTYAVGHPHPHAWLHAALLVAGPQAALSHRTAAVLLELLPHGDGPIHVTSPVHLRTRPGLTLHRATLHPTDSRRRENLSLTSAVRTLHDLAATTDPATVSRALDAAHAQRLVTPAQLHHGITPKRSGAARLRNALDDRPGLTRSEAERRLVALLVRAQLPAPQTNTHVHGYEVDAHWPGHQLIVEVDGYAFHSSRVAFERDRRRDADLLEAGYRTLRVTWRELTERPEAVAVRVAGLLTQTQTPKRSSLRSPTPSQALD